MGPVYDSNIITVFTVAADIDASLATSIGDASSSPIYVIAVCVLNHFCMFVCTLLPFLFVLFSTAIIYSLRLVRTVSLVMRRPHNRHHTFTGAKSRCKMQSQISSKMK